MSHNHCLLETLQRKKSHRRPVWMMRQAGRYLPEYRALRQQTPSFMDFCKTPELACEATLQPLKRFDLDAAIIFSDILTIPEAMGMELQFIKNEGPVFSKAIRHEQQINALLNPDVNESLHYVADAISLTKKNLNPSIPLIGFSGSPWTLATYMIEGSGSKTFLAPRAMLYRNPEALHTLLSKLTTIITDYLLMQIRAGADVIMLFDSWGGLLNAKNYQQFSLQPMQAIIQNIKQSAPDTPIILFSKGCAQALESMAQSGADGLGIDWHTHLRDAKNRVGSHVALQGNLDPAILLSSPDIVQQHTQALLEQYGDRAGHIFNLGHGIDKDTPIDNVSAMLETIRQFDKDHP